MTRARSLTCLLLPFAFVACGDDDGGLSDDDPIEDMGPAFDAAGGDDAGGSADDAGEPVDAFVASCFMPEAALLAPDNPVMLEQEHCTEEEVMDVFACAFDTDSAPDDCEATYGFGAADPSAAIRNSCTTCLLGGGDSAAAPAVLSTADRAYLNIFACQAAALGQPECAVSLSRRFFCTQSACEDCPDDELGACRDEASLDDETCAMFEISDACAPILDAETVAECGGMDFPERFLTIGDYFCGGRPVRGG